MRPTPDPMSARPRAARCRWSTSVLPPRTSTHPLVAVASAPATALVRNAATSAPACSFSVAGLSSRTPACTPAQCSGADHVIGSPSPASRARASSSIALMRSDSRNRAAATANSATGSRDVQVDGMAQHDLADLRPRATPVRDVAGPSGHPDVQAPPQELIARARRRPARGAEARRGLVAPGPRLLVCALQHGDPRRAATGAGYAESGRRARARPPASPPTPRCRDGRSGWQAGP